VPGVVSLSQLLKVLQALLAEQVPVRDIRSIAEAIANNAAKSQDTAALVAAVRVGVSRAIVQSIVGTESELPVITLEPRLEQILLNSLQKAGTRLGRGRSAGAKHGREAAAFADRSGAAPGNARSAGDPAGSRPDPRDALAFRSPGSPGLHVLAYQEIPDNKQVTIVATVGPNG
jgi:flagellar biosynthesis protein FlhA